MKLIFFLVLSFISSVVLGQNPAGCMVYPYDWGGYAGAYSGKVFQDRLFGVSVPPQAAADIQQGQPVYDGSVGIPVDISCYRQPSNTSARECVIRIDLGGGKYDWFGGVNAQSYYGCPIDDKLPIVLLFAGALGFTLIRKKAVKRY